MGYRNTVREKRRRRDRARKEEAFDRHYPGSRTGMVVAAKEKWHNGTPERARFIARLEEGAVKARPNRLDPRRGVGRKP